VPYIHDPSDLKQISYLTTPEIAVVYAVEITEDVHEPEFDVMIYYGRIGNRPDGLLMVQLYEARAHPRKTPLYPVTAFAKGRLIPEELKTFLAPVGYDVNLIVELIREYAP